MIKKHVIRLNSPSAPRIEALTMDGLWQFSLQYYSVDEVKEACLALQNHYHGNVNLLLLLKWLDGHLLGLDNHAWQHIHTALQRSENLLLSFRHLRKSIKCHSPSSVYREALQFELTLEKQQQHDLVDATNAVTDHLLIVTHPTLVERYCHQLDCDKLLRIFSKTYS